MGILVDIYSQLFWKPAYPSKSFAGQIVIVTGSNVGLGKEAARHFARLGASKLILAVRNTTAGEAAKQDIISTTQCDPAAIEVWNLDLSSYDSVKAFAARASAGLARIDVLLENAAVAVDGNKPKYAEGHELSITVNVISTFLLALLLLPKLKATARQFNTQPRLSVVTSGMHAWANMPQWKVAGKTTFEALDEMTDLSDRYPATKLLEVLIMRQLAPKLNGSSVALNMLDPGFCHSELTRDAGWGMTIAKFFLARSTEVGSRTLVAAAEAGPESHGKYMQHGLVDDGALGSFVTGDDGKKASEKIWKELSDILEAVQPGVTSNA